MSNINVEANKIKQLTMDKLEDEGVKKEHAEKISDVLIYADLRGISSHGVLRIKHYINKMKRGGINKNPKINVSVTGPVSSTVNGDNGFGHIIADKSMEVAIDSARTNGIGMVSVSNSSHCGALSFFVNKAVEQGFIGIAMSQTDKIVAPYGGKESFLGTNPMAFAVPAKKQSPFILDMATSKVALGKVLQYKEEKKCIPEGWGVDREGNTVRDPSKVEALTPFGGPKGYGLSLIVDIFAGILGGNTFGPHVNKMYEDLEKYRHLGHYFCAINPSFFTNKENFLFKMDQMIDELHNLEPAQGFEKVFIPGEIEKINEEKSKNEGIEIAESVYNYLLK